MCRLWLTRLLVLNGLEERGKKSLKCRVKLKLTEKSWNEDRIPFCLRAWSRAHQSQSRFAEISQSRRRLAAPPTGADESLPGWKHSENEKFCLLKSKKAEMCWFAAASTAQRAAKNYKNTIGGDQITHEPLKISDIMKRQYISKPHTES